MRKNELRQLQTLLHDSQQYRESIYSEGRWTQLESYWSNRPEHIVPDGIEPQDMLMVPMLVGDGQRQVAQIIGGEPSVNIEAILPKHVPGARVMTSQLNQLIRDIDMAGELSMATQDAVTLGTGFMMGGFGSQYGPSKETSTLGFDDSGVKVDKRSAKETKLEYHDNIKDDMPWALRVHPSNILVPPYTVDLPSAYGFFHRYMRHVDDVKSDDKYSRRYRDSVTPNIGSSSMGNVSEYDSIINDMVVMWDWRSLKDCRKVTFTEDLDHALYDDDDEIILRIDRLPLYPIVFNHKPRAFWGTADFDFQEALQRELNGIRSQMHQNRVSEIPKIFVDVSKIYRSDQKAAVEDTLAELQSMAAMGIIPVEGDPKDVASQFSPHQVSDLLVQADAAKRDNREFVGMGSNQRGEVSSSRNTAREVMLADTRHQQSLDPRRRIVANVIRNWTMDASKLIWEFWKEEVPVQTYDAKGDLVTVMYKGSDLAGDYRYRVSLDSLTSKTRQQSRAESTEIFQILLPMAVPGGPLNVISLIRQWLSRLDTNWDIDNLIAQTPPPQPMGFEQFSQGFNEQQQPPANPNMAAPALDALAGMTG